MERDAWVRDPLVRVLLVIVLAIAVLHLGGAVWNLASQFGDTILLFFLSWILSFMFTPIVGLLMDRCRLPRVLAVLIVYLGFVALLIVGLILVVPLAITQSVQFAEALPGYAAQVPSLGAAIQDWLVERHIPVDIERYLTSDSLTQQATALGTSLAQNAIAIVSATVTTVFNIVLVLILSLYMLLDGGAMIKSLTSRLPEDRRIETEYFIRCIDRTFGGFMRGILLTAVVYGIATAVVMQVASLPYMLPASLFAGLAMIVPFIGGFLGLIPPLIIAWLSGSLATVIAVFIALMIVQQILVNVVSPKVMSEAVGIHPLIVFLAILIGAKIAGAWGALFGVPIAGVISAMAQFFIGREDYLRTLRQQSPAAPTPGEPVEVS